MKPINNFGKAKEAASYTGSAQLPAGAYVCKILGVKYETFDWGDQIKLQIDIEEGEQKDFFKKQYESNTAEDKKWKGIAKVTVPKDEDEEWKHTAFARWPVAIEESNKGYVWDWDENKWKGKLIGIVFGPTGTVIDGKEVVFTEAHGPASVEAVKSGRFYKKLLELKKTKGYTGTQSSTEPAGDNDFMKIPDNASETIPF